MPKVHAICEYVTIETSLSITIKRKKKKEMYDEKLTVTLRMREDGHLSRLVLYLILRSTISRHHHMLETSKFTFKTLMIPLMFCSFFSFLIFQTSTAFLVNASPLSLYIVCVCFYIKFWYVFWCILCSIKVSMSHIALVLSPSSGHLTPKSVCVCGGYHILQNNKYCIILISIT